MPEISRFFGIIVWMYVEALSKHNKLHFHAYYQGFEIVIDIQKVEVLTGKFPKKQFRLILAWAELHQKELIDDWHFLQSGEPAKPIKPLK